MTLLPTIPAYPTPAAPTTTASYYPAHPTTPGYPTYPTTPAYGYDQYQGMVPQLATQVYDLQRVITAAGPAAYGNPSYLAAITDLQQRIGQVRTMTATTPYQTPTSATLDDLANRLARLRSYVAPPQHYTPPTTYPTQPPTYYPQPGYGLQPGYGQQPGYQGPMDPMRMQRRMERLQRREQMIHWRRQQLMQQQQQQNPLAQLIGAFSGLANGGIR